MGCNEYNLLRPTQRDLAGLAVQGMPFLAEVGLLDAGAIYRSFLFRSGCHCSMEFSTHSPQWDFRYLDARTYTFIILKCE